jgi:hypothetical protein
VRFVRFRSVAVLAALLACPAYAGTGLFEGQGDVGAVLHKGSVDYDAASGAYKLTGSGENMWFAADAFYFVWKKVSGDVTITGDISFPTKTGNAHKKAALLIRQSLDANSAYADAALHNNGLTSLQFRETAGANTHEIEAAVSAPARLRLTRKGKYVYMSVAMPGEELHPAGGAIRMEIADPFYIGIGVCAHDKDAIESAVFRNVEISTPAAAPDRPFSTLETITVSSTDRRVVHVAPGRMQMPDWRPDNTLRYMVDERWYRIPADGGTPAPAADATPARPNDTQCTSHDGKRAVLLVPGTDAGESILEMVTLADHKITTLAHFIAAAGSLSCGAWSPDDKRVTFVSHQMLP